MVILGILTSLLVAIALILIIVVSMKGASATAAASSTSKPPATTSIKRGGSWIGWMIAGAVGVIAVLTVLGWISDASRKDATKPPAQARLGPQQMAPTKPERIVEITAPVGQWSEWFTIPALHWFRIEPESKIRAKNVRGQEFELEMGKPVFFGDNISDATFQFTAAGEQPVTVKIVLQPK